MTPAETFARFMKTSQDSLNKEMGGLPGGALVDAIMGACALIASADGEIDADEIEQTRQFLGASKELKGANLNVDAALEAFDRFAYGIQSDRDNGSQAALDAVRVLLDRPTAARMLVLLAVAIGHADGNFDENEKFFVAQIITLLNLELAEFGIKYE